MNHPATLTDGGQTLEQGATATPFLTVAEAANQIGVSISLIYALCKGNRIPHLRVGLRPGKGKILIATHDLAAFLDHCRDGGSSSKDQVLAARHASPGSFTQLNVARLKAAWGSPC